MKVKIVLDFGFQPVLLNSDQISWLDHKLVNQTLNLVLKKKKL